VEEGTSARDAMSVEGGGNVRGVCTRNARLSMTRVRERDFSSTSRCAAARSRGDVALVSVVRFPRVPRNDARRLGASETRALSGKPKRLASGRQTFSWTKTKTK
jgi:hypothetical protein